MAINYRSAAATAARLLKANGQQFTFSDPASGKVYGTLYGITTAKDIRLEGATIGVETGAMVASGSFVPTAGMWIKDAANQVMTVMHVLPENAAGIPVYYKLVTRQ